MHFRTDDVDCNKNGHSPRKRVALVAEGASEASEPGIRNHRRDYGFRACAKKRIPE